MNEARVKYGQSLFDVALEQTGSIESIIELAEQNGLSITDGLTPGDKLLIGDDLTVDDDILTYYNVKGIKPATGYSANGGIQPSEEGISIWAINIDFIVQ